MAFDGLRQNAEMFRARRITVGIGRQESVRRSKIPDQMDLEAIQVFRYPRIFQYVVRHKGRQRPHAEKQEGLVYRHQYRINAFPIKELQRIFKSFLRCIPSRAQHM